MDEHLDRTFKTPIGQCTVRVNPDKYVGHAGDGVTHRAKKDRKFNIRVKQDDLVLLEALAKNAGVPRSVLINTLLHDLLHDELMSIEQDDARALLAVAADGRASYDPLVRAWTHSALGAVYNNVLRNVLEHNDHRERCPDPGEPEDAYHSEAFIGLRDQLGRIDK